MSAVAPSTDEHPVARVVLPLAAAVGLVGYGALYLAALAFYTPLGALPEDAGLTQAVLLVRLVVLVTLLAVALLVWSAAAALVVAAVDGGRRLAGRPRLALDRRPGPRTAAVGVALLSGLLAAAPWSGAWPLVTAGVALLVLAAGWLARRVTGGVRAPAAALALAVWAGAAVGLVNLGNRQADQLVATGTWDEDVELLGVYPAYAYLGEEYGESADGTDEPYVSLGDDAGVFVLLSCRDARTVRVSTTVVSVTLASSDADTDAARDRCQALRTAAGR